MDERPPPGPRWRDRRPTQYPAVSACALGRWSLHGPYQGAGPPIAVRHRAQPFGANARFAASARGARPADRRFRYSVTLSIDPGVSVSIIRGDQGGFAWIH